jgi:hypothetical protein
MRVAALLVSPAHATADFRRALASAGSTLPSSLARTHRVGGQVVEFDARIRTVVLGDR